LAQAVEGAMRSFECLKYADQCAQMAHDVAPEYRELLLKLADKWREAAFQLEMCEDVFNNQHNDVAR
jgi:hypothetical protein